jgi:hypothetical protein
MNSRLPTSHSIKQNIGVKSYSRIMKKRSYGLIPREVGVEVDDGDATVYRA